MREPPRVPASGRIATVLLAALALAAAPVPVTAAEAPAAPRSSAPAAKPAHICSLSLAADEALALLVPVERVACVSSFADDPELSNVAGHYPKAVPRLAAHIEPVLAAHPDLVIVAPWNEASFGTLLARTGVASYVLPDANDFAEIRAALLALGERVGEPARAAEAAATLDRRLAALDAALAGVTARPRVLAFSHLIVAGADTTVDALMRRAGARNAAAELGVHGHKQVPMEQIIALDPDWLLLGFDPGERSDTLLDAYPLLRTTRAAREGRVIVLPPRLLTSVSPYLVEGAEQLARALHPRAFAGAAK